MRKIVIISVLMLSISSLWLGATTPDSNSHSFEFGGPKGQQFLLDSEPFQIRAGEIHPQRIPKEYWQHRIQMAKAMGLNTIAFYVFWNDFEQTDGSFDFTTGNRDIAGFLKLCAEEKMWVLFRPGPYACGEWDLGGLPHYLLKNEDAQFRTMNDLNFMNAQQRYLEAISILAKPYLIQNGGPILMTQIENEFGSYARKHESKYMQWLKDFWTSKGFGPFYTSDGAGDSYLKGVVLPGVAVGLDPGESMSAFNTAYRNNPGVPAFSSETYPGWLRHWGEGNWTATNKSKKIKWFMKKGYSFNIFVFHGGTNFGFTAGANNNHQEGGEDSYQPDLTSYDYGSPCDEQGNPTKEYFQYRKIIKRYLKGETLAKVPASIPSMKIPTMQPEVLAPLRALAQDSLEQLFENPPYFEFFNQNQGMAIYQTELPAGPDSTLEFEFFHDFGHILVDGVLISTVDRRLDFQSDRKRITIPARSKAVNLEIIVEAMGHTNFHITMELDRKGLYGKVLFDNAPLTGWNVFPIPLDVTSVENVKPGKLDGKPGAIFSCSFSLEKTADTFLDMSKYSKGTVYINGFNLGRYWNVGPQLRLFCPASLLKIGENKITIVDLIQQKAQPIRGCTERNYDMNDTETVNNNNVW